MITYFRKFLISFVILLLMMVKFQDISAQTSIADNIEMTSLLDFYNSTSQNNTAPWTSNWGDVDYRWNIVGLANTNFTFDDFELIYNSTNQTYTSDQLKGVVLNANKDVIEITLADRANAKGFIPTSIVNLANLKKLLIHSFNISDPRNEITGTLPDLGGLHYLETLDLAGNDCTGTISWLGSNGTFSNALTSIDLSSNDQTPDAKLTIFPGTGFSNLINLKDLNLDNNQFTTIASPINNIVSVHFQYLDNLTSLSIKNCDLISSSFSEFDNFAIDGMAKIKTLYLSKNPIINVPSQIGKLPTLEELHLASVSLQSIHHDIDKLDNLTWLDLASNSLTENGLTTTSNFYKIINELTYCNVLNKLDLTDNGLTELSSNFNLLTPLRTLILSLNPIGVNDLEKIQGSQITSLTMEACNLKTSIPSYITGLPLVYLNLSNNVIQKQADWATNLLRNNLNLSNSKVEGVLTGISTLTQLYIRWFAIEGPAVLPDWFGSDKMNNLKILHLENNQLQLPLPPSFFQMHELTELDMYDNSLSGSVKSSDPLRDFNCTNFPKIVDINLGDNALTNPLPDLGSCTVLQTLNISYNQLSGDVPTYFQSALPALTTLHIENNNFDNIPNLTTRTNPLTYVNLSQNKFDFGDLDTYFDALCNPKISKLVVTPQQQQSDKKGLGVPFSMPENLSITLKFQAWGDEPNNNYYEWFFVTGNRPVGLQFSDNSLKVTNDSYTITNLTPATAGVYRTNIRNRCISGVTFISNDVTVNIIPPLCQSEIPLTAGAFKLDKLTGSIVFERDDCPVKMPVSCVFGPASTIDNVVSARAITHTDDWSYSYLGLTASNNPFESGDRGKWRAKASYTYNAPIVQSNDKNYNAGTFKYKTFNYKYGEGSNYPGWLKVNQIERYSQHGEPVEERNAINIPSAAKFGYNAAVPYLVAQNSTYQAVLFESFENLYGSSFEDGFAKTNSVLNIDPLNAHSGKNSLQLTGSTFVDIKTFTLDDQIKAKGIQAKVWVKGTLGAGLSFQFASSAGSAPLSGFTRIASSGEWGLYEAILPASNFSALAINSTFILKLILTGTGSIYADDLRIQPMDAEMTAYVYEVNTLRLLAVFDDQHFGLFYQYNAEGKLVRKMIETERGLKTVQETQYNMPKVTKN